MRTPVVGIAMLLAVAGCGTHKSSLLLERHSRGPLDAAPLVGYRVAWRLTPVMQTQTKEGVEIIVNHASKEFLNNFFRNTKLFGVYAGANPYFPEQIVFYVKIANHSTEKAFMNPARFILTDDQGNQYATIGMDYVTALAEAHEPLITATRGVIEEARPGYFGVSVPVGKLVATKPQGAFALMKQSQLEAGSLYPGVVYDGLLAFWSPALNAKKLHLLLTGIKTDFDANEVPRKSLEFSFDFDATHEPHD